MSVTFSAVKNGMFRLLFVFENTDFSRPRLVRDTGLWYADETKNAQYFPVDPVIYQGLDTGNYQQFTQQQQERFIVLFVPFALLETAGAEHHSEYTVV